MSFFVLTDALPCSLEWKGRAFFFCLPHAVYYAAAIRNAAYSKADNINLSLVIIRYRVAIGLLVCLVFTVYARDREVRLRAQFTKQLAVAREGVSSTKAFLLVDVSNPQEPSILDMNSSARALLITKEPTGYDLIGQLLTQFSSSIRKDTGMDI